ncbi:MAG: HEAT repeat domain-containing protein [Deltaproteobacteria bacterium]|nr:HEAT repeat domain-containing protein [Deltaproteobacteria bacterium]
MKVRLAIGAGLVLVAALAWWLGAGGVDTPPEADEPEERSADTSNAAFRVELVDEGVVETPGEDGAGTRAKLSWKGTVLLLPVPSHPSWSVLVVHAIDEAEWTMNEQAMPDAAERFAGAEVYVRHGSDGRVESVEADDELAAPVARVLETMALGLHREHGGPGETFESDVRTPFGVVTAGFETDAECPAAPCSFDASYQGSDYLSLSHGESATGRGLRQVAFREGELHEVDLNETERVSGANGRRLGERTVHLHLTRAELPDALPRARLRGSRVSVADLVGDARERGLQQRVGDLTVERMLADLAAALGGRLPDHDRWLWRATGLLQLDPTAAMRLADACLDGTLEGRPRQVALELLANVGDPAAQRALRRVLADPSVASGDDYPRLVQRSALLRDPEDETIDLLTRQGEELSGPSSRASFVAAGGAVGHARTQDPARGAEAVRRLQESFGAATDPADRQALVMALGNTGAPEARDDLLGAARSTEDSELRRVAARALGHFEDETSADQLVAMVDDEDPLVQRAALDALSENRPSSAQLEALARVARDLPTQTRVAIVTLVERLMREPSDPALRPGLLQVVLAIRGTTMPDDAAHRLMAVYRVLSGQGPR